MKLVRGAVVKVNSKMVWAVSCALLVGVQLLRARITFTDATRPANLRIRYRSCAAATRVVPRFTG
jgi:hypothetical protein